MILLLVLIGAVAMLNADTAPRIAIPEFENSSGKLVQLNRWDLAVWMGKELEKTHQYKAIDRKSVNEITKDVEWQDNGLGRVTEARLKDLPADYVLYGSIQEWRVAENIISRRYSGTRSPDKGPPGVTVVFSIRLVDLNGTNPEIDFLVDGNALGDPEGGFGDPPYQENDARFAHMFEEASKKALRKAAQNITEHTTAAK